MMKRRHLIALPLLLPCLAPLLVPAPAAAAPAHALQLPLKPSEMLRAPLAEWQPLLQRMTAKIEAELANPDGLSRAQLSEHLIGLTLIAQAREQWALVRAPVERARRQQEHAAGRHTAGVINELLAAQRLGGHDARWLRAATAQRFGAMPWDAVGEQLRGMQSQLQAMSAETIEAYVERRLDPSAAFAKNQVSLGFAQQLLGVRVQLLQVLPQRDALVAGLGDVIARHPAPSPATPASA